MAAEGSLRGRSLPELREMLRRQQRLLADRKFIDRLPDKGKKISEFAEKLALAVLREEELAAAGELLAALRLGRGGGQQPPGTQQRGTASPQEPCENASGDAAEVSSQGREAERSGATNTALENQRTQRETEAIWTVAGGQSAACEAASQSAPSSQQRPQSAAGDSTESTEASDSSRDPLVDAFQKVTIVDGDDSEKTLGKEQNLSKHRGSAFGSLHPRTPHYIEVLESRAKNPVIKKSKFKTNALSGEQSGSSRGSSPSRSPGGSASPLTAEERRLRDKKHLNDITAARLPPLHHAPAKLLSIEESIAIQIQQKEAYEEMQAKLAAQKLAERLNIKMTSFEPEGDAATQYREVRDEDYFSAED